MATDFTRGQTIDDDSRITAFQNVQELSIYPEQFSIALCSIIVIRRSLRLLVVSCSISLFAVVDYFISQALLLCILMAPQSGTCPCNTHVGR